MRRADLAELVKRLADAFPAMRHRAERVRSWTAFLAERDHGIAEQAIDNVLASSRRAPSVAALADAYRRAEAAQRREQLRTSEDGELPEPTADERERVLREMRAYAQDRWGAPS